MPLLNPLPECKPDFSSVYFYLHPKTQEFPHKQLQQLLFLLHFEYKHDHLQIHHALPQTKNLFPLYGNPIESRQSRCLHFQRHQVLLTVE